jgi:isocitrate dehydrogenase (NAD+)
MALDLCTQFERKIRITGRSDGATGEDFGRYVLETVARDDLEKVWMMSSGAGS